VKILDRYILRSFLVTFATVFVILFLIFILQTVWLFIGELAGKDLDLGLIVKFLAFKMPSIVPLVLPLSIVLASIMTFGGLAENYEFAAMKSAGISLKRAMAGLTAFICVLSVASFLFANNVIPYAEYKFINFRRNLAQVKPAMAIAEGQFNDIGAYNIKVDKKSGENGNQLTGVTIHKKASSGMGNNAVVIKARDGELISNENSNILKLVLNDGYYYEDILAKKPEERNKLPFAKSSFRKYIINIDLSQLNKADLDNESITNTNTMLNVRELSYTLDSLENSYDKEVMSFGENIYQRTGLLANSVSAPKLKRPEPATVPGDVLADFSGQEKSELLRVATSNVANIRFSIDGSRMEMENRVKNINNHWIALHDKFVIAYACFLMFFIGAPLGAIIRKGGLGLPIVFAILVFIVFHFINTFGKKLAQEDGITPFLGTWMSSIVLTPLAVMLTHRATNDKQVTFDFDWLLIPFRKMFVSPKERLADSERIVNLAAHDIPKDEDWFEMSKLGDAALTGIVYDAQKFEYADVKRLQALRILEERGITQDDLLREGKLYNKQYEELAASIESYRLDAKVSLVMFAITAVLAAIAQNNIKLIWLIIPSLLFFAALVVSIYKAEQRLDEISKLVGKDIGMPIWTVLIVGPLFYPFVFLFNKRTLKKALQQSNV
jgi:lipopolysaccharide export system permease protein